MDLLIEQARKGDVNAQEQILERLRPLVLSSIRKYYYRAPLFEDLVQEGFVEILECIHSYDPSKGAHFLGYVKLRLRFLYLNRGKERTMSSLDDARNGGDPPVEQLVDDSDFVADLLQKETEKELFIAFSTLTPKEQSVLYDFYFNDHSIAAIAKKNGTSYRTVVNNKSRALKKLKRILEPID